MAIDANILLQGQPVKLNDPLLTMGRIQGVRSAQIQNQEAQLKLNSDQQGATDDADTRAAFAAGVKVDPTTGQPTFDRQAALNTIGKLNPAAYTRMASTFAQQDQAASTAKASLDKAQADAQSAQVKAALAHTQAIDNLLQGVNDQPSYTSALQHAQSIGIVKPGELPPQYDPQLVQRLHAQTLSQQDVLTQHLKERDADRADQTQAEIEDNNAAQRDQAAAQLAQTTKNEAAEIGIRRQQVGIEGARLALERQKEATSKGDPNLAAQLLINGDATLSELKARGSTPEFIAKTLDAAHQMSGGKYNSQAADAQFSVAKSPTNVAFFGSAKSLTDQGGTLDQLKAAAADIPSHQIPVFNTVADAEKAATGSGPIAKYASLMLGVSDDYSKVMGGGQGSDASRNQALRLVPANASPEARAAAIDGIRGAVGSQISSRIGSNPILKRMYGGDSGGPQSGGAAPAKPAGVPAGAKWDPSGNGGKGSWKL